MKKFTKVIALILSLTLLLCFPIGVSAAEPEDTGVDTAAKGSLTIYKVDLTNAKKDLEAQADPYSTDAVALRGRYGAKVVNRDFDGDPDRITEMDALVAYLQMLGTQVDFKSYKAQAPENQR